MSGPYAGERERDREREGGGGGGESVTTEGRERVEVPNLSSSAGD